VGVSTSDIFGPHLVEKTVGTTININLQTGWIINAVWQFSELMFKHRTRINTEAQIILWDVRGL